MATIIEDRWFMVWFGLVYGV